MYYLDFGKGSGVPRFNPFFIPKLISVNNEVTNDLMQLILNLRNDAKRNKDFITADTIRDKLKKIGIKIKDHREGTNWEQIN